MDKKEEREGSIPITITITGIYSSLKDHFVWSKSADRKYQCWFLSYIYFTNVRICSVILTFISIFENLFSTVLHILLRHVIVKTTSCSKPCDVFSWYEPKEMEQKGVFYNGRFCVTALCMSQGSKIRIKSAMKWHFIKKIVFHVGILGNNLPKFFHIHLHFT